MSIDFDTSREAFTQQSTNFLTVVDATPDLAAPTGLDGWDCAVLVGHVSTALEAFWRWRGDRPDGVVELDRISWLDAADPSINDDFSQRYASKRSHEELREIVADTVARANEFLADASPDWVLVGPGGIAWTRFDQALATRIFELTVHGLDLAAVTGSTIVPEHLALTVTGEILDRRLAGDRPPDLRTDLDWVRAASGRIEHPDQRLPVMP